MNNALIEVNNLTVEFPLGNLGFSKRKHLALDAVNFVINKGEIFGVLGRNGCGKSTLLQVLAGVCMPNKGHVVERSDKPLKKALLTLGLGFDQYLSGRDNALISAMLQGLDKREALAILDDIKIFSELGDFFEEPVFRYSSGMRSKLGFATAMQLQTDILLVDETLSVGDDSFRKKAETALLNKMAGSSAVVFVSHNAQQMKRLCERAVWLERGRVMDFGDTARVSKSYIDFMNKLKATAAG